MCVYAYFCFFSAKIKEICSETVAEDDVEAEQRALLRRVEVISLSLSLSKIRAFDCRFHYVFGFIFWYF